MYIRLINMAQSCNVKGSPGKFNFFWRELCIVRYKRLIRFNLLVFRILLMQDKSHMKMFHVFCSDFQEEGFLMCWICFCRRRSSVCMRSTWMTCCLPGGRNDCTLWCREVISTKLWRSVYNIYKIYRYTAKGK